jgi:hypothetical protein
MLSSMSRQNRSKSPLAERTQRRRLALQAAQQQDGVQHDHLQPAVDRIRHPVGLVKGRRARLCHDHAIESGDGVVPRGAAKQAQYHRVSSAASRKEKRRWRGLPGTSSRQCPH